MPPSLPPLPTPLQTTLRSFRPLFHATTWLVFLGVLTGLLTGHTTLACVRASLLCADGQLAAVLRLLPPRPLVALRLPGGHHRAGAARALPRWPAGPAVVGGRHDHQRQAVGPQGVRHPDLLAGLPATRPDAHPPGPRLAAAGPPLPAGRRLLAGVADRRPLVAPVAVVPRPAA